MESPEGDLGKVPSRTLLSLGSLPACQGWMEILSPILLLPSPCTESMVAAAGQRADRIMKKDANPISSGESTIR
jgi:hypothetical protein